MEKLNALAGIKQLFKKITSDAEFPMPAFMKDNARKAEAFNAQYKPLFLILVKKYGATVADHMASSYHKAGQDSNEPAADVILRLMREAANAPNDARIFCSDCQKTTSHEIHWHNGGVYEGHVWRCRQCKRHGAWIED